MAHKNLLADRMHKSVIQDESVAPSQNSIPQKQKASRSSKKTSKKDKPSGTDANEKSRSVVKPFFFTFIKIIIAVLCVYICFLIYGVLSTEYKYDAEGEIYPEVLSVSDIHNLNQYETLAGYYLRSRALYENILSIDKSLADHPENALTIAMDYTEQLEIADKLLIDLNAAEYDTRYSSLYSNVGAWTNNACQYLQYISSAITNNNAADAETALTLRDKLYNEFASITANIATLAENTKGANNSAIYEWSPESFVAELGEDE